MSSELERRLEGFLHELPEPEQGVGERALAASLAAIRPIAPARRGLRTAVVVFAAAFVLLGIAAGSLAAAGALHVSLGTKTKPHVRATDTLRLPPGADGIAAVVDGRLSVVTRTGFRLQGLSVSAAALSPHALYVAAGIGDSLVAMAPSGRRAWSHSTGGTVVAIAWAPFGNRIAYIVHTGRRFVLHVIWGNGTNDVVIDRSVRPVHPSWRADSLAFAYVGAGGKAIVYDLVHRSRDVVHAHEGAVTQLAFAPAGRALAIAGHDVFSTVDDCGRAGGNDLDPRVGWIDSSLLVTSGTSLDSYTCGANFLMPAHLGIGKVVAFYADGRHIIVAVADKNNVRILAGSSNHWNPLSLVARLPGPVSVKDLQLG